MSQYTVEQFRKNMREALNDAEANKQVVIVRHGVKFYITTNVPDDRQFVEVGASTRTPKYQEPRIDNNTDWGA